MTSGVNCLPYEDESDCLKQARAAVYQPNTNLSADRACLPFPEMGMDLEAIEAYLEADELEPA